MIFAQKLVFKKKLLFERDFIGVLKSVPRSQPRKIRIFFATAYKKKQFLKVMSNLGALTGNSR